MKIRILIITVMVIHTFCACSKSYDVNNNFSKALEDYSKKNFTDAEYQCNKILKLDKHYYPALFIKAKILFYTERKTEAVKLLEKIIKENSSYIDAKLFLIKFLIDLNELEKAKKHLDNLVLLNSNDYRVYYLYSLFYNKKNDTKNRLKFQKQAEKCIEESNIVFLDLANTYSFFGLTDISNEYYEKAEKISLDEKTKYKIKKMYKEN